MKKSKGIVVLLLTLILTVFFCFTAAIQELNAHPGKKFIISNYTATQPTRNALIHWISKNGGNVNEYNH